MGQVLVVCKHEVLVENGLIPSTCIKVRIDGVCNSSGVVGGGFQMISCQSF